LDTIKNFYREEGKDRLFCTLIGDPTGCDECIVYFAPLFEERMWTQRIAFNFSCDVWKECRIPTFVFDYYGYGESDGDAEDFTLSRCRRDFLEHVAFLRQTYGTKRITLWGVRTGCVVALSCLSDQVPVSSQILWTPVVDLKTYVEEELRAVLSYQTSVFKKILATRKVILEELLDQGHSTHEGYILNNLDGYRFGKAFYQEVSEMTAKQVLGEVRSPSLILNGISEKRNKPFCKEQDLLQELQDKHKDISVQDVTIHSYWAYTLNYTQRLEPLFSLTLDWLKNRPKIVTPE